MTLALAENWLKAIAEDELGDAVTVTTGPGEWDAAYLKDLLTKLPAVVIVWMGGSAADSTSLTLDATWVLYVITGGRGKGTEAYRRRGNPTASAYLIVTALASRLHNASMGQVQYSADGSRIPGADPIEGFGLLRIADVVNETSGNLELWGRMDVTVYAIEIDQNMPLLGPDSAGFDDWLRTNLTLDIPEGDEFDPDTDEIGVDGDVPGRFDMPQ